MSPALIPKIATSSNMNIYSGTFSNIKFTFVDTGTIAYKATVDGTNWKDTVSGSTITFDTAGSTVCWSGVGLSGNTITNVTLDLLDVSDVVFSDYTDNKLMNDGLNQIAQFTADDGTYSRPTYMALGLGTTVFTSTDTTLKNEHSRSALSVADKGTGILDYTFEIIPTTAILSHEIGYFNAATTGNMYYAKQFGSTVTLSKHKLYSITQRMEITNATEGNKLITYEGLDMVEKYLRGGTTIRPDYTAWGTGTAALSQFDTTLQGQFEINSIPALQRTGAIVQMNNILAVDEGTTADVTKTGIFYGSTTTKTLLMESKFSAIDKNALFQIGNIDTLEYK